MLRRRSFFKIFAKKPATPLEIPSTFSYLGRINFDHFSA